MEKTSVIVLGEIHYISYWSFGGSMTESPHSSHSWVGIAIAIKPTTLINQIVMGIFIPGCKVTGYMLD